MCFNTKITLIIKSDNITRWFSGQLDGEIRNGNGWNIDNNVTASNVIEPTFISTMSRSDF